MNEQPLDRLLEMKMDIRELKRLCIEFDKKYGEYPEHCLEGRAVYGFIIELIIEDLERTWEGI